MVRGKSSAVRGLPAIAGAPLAVECLRRWNKYLRRHQYTAETLRQTFGIRCADEFGLGEREVWAEHLRAQSNSAQPWFQLFWLEQPLQREVADKLAPDLVELGLRAGLLRENKNHLIASLRAEPVVSNIVWSDRRFERPLQRSVVRRRGGPVYPPSADSHMLAEVLPPMTGQQLLDLCTGSGVLAILAAQAGAKVTGVDIDARAVELATLNALANGLPNLTFVCGNLYEPVHQRRFHSIVANPPFVCSPYTGGPRYHSGGPLGDEILRPIVAGFATYLHRGGTAVTISHVGLRAGESLSDRARTWLGNFDGRALVVEFERADIVRFAAAQAGFALAEGLASYKRELHRWLRFLRRHWVHEVAAIFLAAERSGKPQLEVVSAKPVVVPVPLNKSAAQVVKEWWPC
ncbi:MAG: hypothetical protein KatS3mg077_0871 [Candidatus Binatia bacterium]|nr:MAG: hypothetical protein KatS3mg077_0871 [Candidatus Binatia bacterium]